MYMLKIKQVLSALAEQGWKADMIPLKFLNFFTCSCQGWIWLSWFRPESRKCTDTNVLCPHSTTLNFLSYIMIHYLPMQNCVEGGGLCPDQWSQSSLLHTFSFTIKSSEHTRDGCGKRVGISGMSLVIIVIVLIMCYLFLLFGSVLQDKSKLSFKTVVPLT